MKMASVSLVELSGGGGTHATGVPSAPAADADFELSTRSMPGRLEELYDGGVLIGDAGSSSSSGASSPRSSSPRSSSPRSSSPRSSSPRSSSPRGSASGSSLYGASLGWGGAAEGLGAARGGGSSVRADGRQSPRLMQQTAHAFLGRVGRVGRVGHWSPRRVARSASARRRSTGLPEADHWSARRPESFAPMRTHLVVLGAPSVGKSTVIEVLRNYASQHHVDLTISEQMPDTDGARAEALWSATPLIVWDATHHFDSMGDDASPPAVTAVTGGSLAQYTVRHIRQLAHGLTAHAMAERERDSYSSATGRAGKAGKSGKSGRAADGETAAAMESRLEKMLTARKIVLCNKTDVQPCPLPQTAALDSGTIFLAGSALRGTNMKELWRRVETCAARTVVRVDRL